MDNKPTQGGVKLPKLVKRFLNWYYTIDVDNGDGIFVAFYLYRDIKLFGITFNVLLPSIKTQLFWTDTDGTDWLYEDDD